MSQDALDRAVERTRAERRERRARHARACFRGHARIYLIVNLGLVGAWVVDRLVTGEEDLWFLGSLVGWGVGLLAHWILARPAFHRRSDQRLPKPATEPGLVTSAMSACPPQDPASPSGKGEAGRSGY